MPKKKGFSPPFISDFGSPGLSVCMSWKKIWQVSKKDGTDLSHRFKSDCCGPRHGQTHSENDTPVVQRSQRSRWRQNCNRPNAKEWNRPHTGRDKGKVRCRQQRKSQRRQLLLDWKEYEQSNPTDAHTCQHKLQYVNTSAQIFGVSSV